MGTITVLLQRARGGSSEATDRLFELVYDDLKIVARRHLRNHRAGVLQVTALVNAAYTRLAAKETLKAQDRKEFFFILSRAMHDILVEQARSELAQKRGGGARRVPLVEIVMDDATRQINLIDLQEALSELGAEDPAAARVVLLRFYGGLTLRETAHAMGETFAIVRRHWDYAKAWLHVRLAHYAEDGSRPGSG